MQPERIAYNPSGSVYILVPTDGERWCQSGQGEPRPYKGERTARRRPKAAPTNAFCTSSWLEEIFAELHFFLACENRDCILRKVSLLREIGKRESL
jgi:hypothetical protein